MAKRKRQKSIDPQNTKTQPKIETHELYKNGFEFMYPGKVSSSCSTSGTRRVIDKRHEQVSISSLERFVISSDTGVHLDYQCMVVCFACSFVVNTYHYLL